MYSSDDIVNVYGEVENITNFVFVHPHCDEVTSFLLGKEFIDNNLAEGMIFIASYSNGEPIRNINIEVEGEVYSIDPNRIFTKNGILNTIDPEYNEAVAELATQVGNHIVKLVDKKPIIALHNNKEFSIDYYLQGGEYEQTTKHVYINEDHEKSDFILTTDNNIFDYVKQNGYNAVLQDSSVPESQDDGSLSIYAMYNDLQYTNIEARHGHFDTQREMMELMLNFFKEC